MAKRVIDIEALVRWAYRDELPKLHVLAEALAQRPGLATCEGRLRERGELGTLIDARENRYGIVPDFTAEAAPHPDAIALAEAVLALDGLDCDWPEGWCPLADLDLAGEEAAVVGRARARLVTVDGEGRTRLRTSPSRLIRKHAILGGAPDWRFEQPERCVVRAANGKPRWFRRVVIVTGAGSMEVEVDGLDPRRRIPMPDAYRKHYWEPDPVEAVEARAEYQLWRAALAALVESLGGALSAFAPVAPARPEAPWETGEAPGRRVLPSLLPVREALSTGFRGGRGSGRARAA